MGGHAQIGPAEKSCSGREQAADVVDGSGDVGACSVVVGAVAGGSSILVGGVVDAACMAWAVLGRVAVDDGIRAGAEAAMDTSSLGEVDPALDLRASAELPLRY